MAQYGSNVPGSPGNGSTCDVTNGSSTVTINGVDATSYLTAGDLFAAGSDVVSYEIASVSYASPDTTVTLSSAYAGTTATGIDYVINTGFTANRGYARPDQGDVRGLLATRAALVKIDADMATSLQAATTTQAGQVELATDAETQTGTDTDRAVTPAGLSSRSATTSRTGLVELATQTETNAGTDTDRAVTPATLDGRTATTTRAGVVEKATEAEMDSGTADKFPDAAEIKDHVDGRIAEQVDSVSNLRSASFPASVTRLYLSGYYGVGTAGGGPLYYDSSDTTTSDNGGTVFVDADGKRWKRSVDRITSEIFGTRGDRTTDDTASINSMTQYVFDEGGGKCFLSEADGYLISDSVQVKEGVLLIGSYDRGRLVADATAPPFESVHIFGGRSGIKDLFIESNAATGTNNGGKRVFVGPEDPNTGTPGSGPTDVTIENVKIFGSIFEGLRVQGATDVYATNFKSQAGRGHGIVSSNATRFIVDGFYVEAMTEGTLGGGKYGVDLSAGSIQCRAVNGAVVNCGQGLKIDQDSVDRQNDYCTLMNIDITGGANSTERALAVYGKNSAVKNITINATSYNFDAGEDRVVDVTFGAPDSYIENIKIRGLTASIVAIYNNGGNKISYKHLDVQGSPQIAFRNNGGSDLLIEDMRDSGSTSRTFESLTDGSVPTNITLRDVWGNDEIFFDDGAETNSVEGLTLENVHTTNGAINLQNAKNFRVSDCSAIKSGSKPVVLVSPVNGTLKAVTGDNVDQSDVAFNVTNPQWVSFFGCVGRNASEAFTQAGSDTANTLVGCINDNCTSARSGWASSYIAGGNI